MPQIIEIPDIGQVEFPDGMSDADIARAIQNNYGTPQPQSPLGMGAARQKAELEAAGNDPSMTGSFLRNARENLGAGIGGALAGTFTGGKTGAAIGAMGGNPLTVGIGTIGGGLIGGVAGAFGGQKIQEAVDPITAERQAALERDREVNPIASFGGQVAPALITGKFSPGTIRTALTPLGRAANAAERAAIINSRINVGSEVAVGGAFDAGQSLAMDQPLDPRQIALNAAAGALFSNPNRLGRALGQGAMIPAPEQPVEPAVATPEPTATVTPPPPAASPTPPMRGPMAPLAPTPPAPPAPPLVATGTTRLAGDLAQQAGIDPLTLTPSGAGATVTPNDVRAAGANLPATTMDSGGTIDVTPPRKPDPTLSDLIDTNVEWDGQMGKLVDDEGRPSLLRADGALVELPFSYGTDRSLTELGVQPTFDRQQDRATATRFFGETENESLQSVFSVIDNNTDDLLDIAELGVSLKKQKGRKSIPVYDTPEFSPQLRSITDEQILVAEDQIKQAIAIAQNNPTLSDETRTAVIDKLSGDLENIAAITAARDAGKYQRLPLPVSSPEIPSQRASLAAADATSNANAARRILNNEPPLPAVASAAPASAKLTIGPEATGIAPVAPENAGAPPIASDDEGIPSKIRLGSVSPKYRSAAEDIREALGDAVGFESDGDKRVVTPEGVQLEVDNFGNFVILKSVSAPSNKRGEGLATEVMRRFVGMADDYDVPVKLIAKPFGSDGNNLNKEQLIRWYEKFGFVAQANGETMIRQPKSAKDTQAQTEATVVPEPQRGDRFKDGDGNTWEVWKNRQGVIEAHPVVNGKVVINNQSGQRWAVSEMSKARNPEFRTDINPLDAPPVPITETQAEAPVAKIKLYRGVQKGKESQPTVRDALFMSPDRKVAEAYAGESGTVAEYDVVFNNLLDVPKWIDAKEKLGLPKSATMENIVNKAREDGYDGVSFTTLNGKEYIQIQPDATSPTPEPAPRQLSPRTRVKNLGAEIEATGKEIMAQRVKIDELKKGGAPKQTITKAENRLASLQSTQKELVAQRGEAKSEIPRVIKTASKGASRILRSVDNNIDSFPGLSSLDGNRIKSPSPQVALILGKKKNGITLSAKENNILAENVRGGEYDGWIKISDVDAMPGTPEGKEAAKELLRSIYAKHDDSSASGPDNVVQDKDADTLWSELRSEIEDIAQGKTRDYQDESDTYYARLEEEALQKEPANRPVSPMDIRNQDSRQLFDDDGGFALASESTQDGAKITAERDAKEEAARAQDEAQTRLFDEEEDAPLFGVRPDEISPDNMPFSKTDAPARTADITGVEKAADDFFGGKRPENVKVVNEPKADWEARVNGDTIELNAAKVGPEGVRSALHEEVGHTAFRDEKERAVFQRLYDSLDEDTRTKINDTVDKLYSDAPTSVKAEEKLVKALRSILDRTPEGRTFWQKLLQIARRTWKNLTGQAAKDPEIIAAALLKRGMGKVKSGMADGPTRYSKVDDAKPATSFREALDAAKQEVADRADYRTQAKTVLAEIAKLPKDQQKPARIRMHAELDEARIIGKGKDQQFKVEMPKVTQELIASGKTPNEQDILNALVAKFPEQKGYLKKNFERLVTDMMFAEEMAMSGNKTPWGDYGDAMKEHLAEIASGVRDGSTLRHIQRGLSLFRNTYFNGIGGKMQALAEGKITGKDSAAANKFFADIMGVRASQDGVNFEGADGLSEADLRRMNNERIKFDTGLDAYFKKEGINDAARAAWLERVADHVVNPARDAELAKEPKLKEAVDYFIKRRRERLAYLRNAGVDVGDAGERSLSRSIDTEKVLTNPKEFIEKAKRAYMRKWAREISQLREQEAIKAAEGKDTTSIKDKIRELEKMDAQAAAEKYLYAITSDNNGISSDGNDITAAEGGGQPSFLKKREFGPEADELLGKFYHRNIAAMDTAEALATVRAATKARVLSSRSDGKIDPVGKWKALRAQLEAEGNQDMIPIAAQLVKDYLNLNGSNNETVRRLVGHLHTYTQLAYLSHATVASLGEPAMIGARTGRITDTGRAYAQIAKGIVRALRKAGPDEIRILNRELGLVADSFDGLMSSNALGDSFGGRGKGGRLVTNFHRLTGLSGWTNLTFDAATKIGKSFISSQVKLAKAGGSMSTLAKRELNELGMSTKDIDVMAAFVTKLDKATDQNKLILGDDPGAALYRKALSMFHKTGAALNPTRGTRAQKANNPVAGMFYQLQSFLYDFHQKFTLRQARRLKDAYRGTVEIDGATEKLSTRERSQVAIDAAKAIAAIYGLQYGIQVLRETIFVDLERNKRDKEKTQAEVNMARALGAASRTGILGPYDTLFNIVSGARYQREPATVVLGPAVGGMSELFQSVVNLYGERNSANTNTAERKLARTGYNTIATPALNAVFAGMPAGPLSAALVQAFRHPLARESAVSAVAGPIQTKKKGPMKTTTYY
jgi:hypothetical protein